MYAMMEGKIIENSIDSVLLKPIGSGITYEIRITEKTANELASAESVAKLYLYFRVNEHFHQLIGFLTLEEKKLFEDLMNVNGVGPLTALAITGIGSPENIYQAIRMGNYNYLARGKRVGEKVAQKIILALQAKFR